MGTGVPRPSTRSPTRSGARRRIRGRRESRPAISTARLRRSQRGSRAIGEATRTRGRRTLRQLTEKPEQSAIDLPRTEWFQDEPYDLPRQNLYAHYESERREIQAFSSIQGCGPPIFVILCFQLLTVTRCCIPLKIRGLSAKRVRGKAESVHQHCPCSGYQAWGGY